MKPGVCMRPIAMIMAVTIAAPATAQTAKTTIQQDFEAATALHDAGKYAEAVKAWQALEPRVARNVRTRALVRVRKSDSLVRQGRYEDAAVAARAGLSELPATDDTLREDRFLALMTVGNAALYELDYATGAGAYRDAESIAKTDAEKLTVLTFLVRAETFTDPQAGLATLRRLDALVAKTKVDPTSLGLVKIAASELYLNLGRFGDAGNAGRIAVKALGGLTLRVNQADIAARWNTALAALKLGKDEEARQYLAYTGAGRTGKGGFSRPVQLAPPDCGGEAGILPDDVAVIEFSVGANGAVTNSVPVYSSGRGEVAIAFARAAREWSWTPEQMTELPAFFRTRTRVELRCTSAFQRPSVISLMTDSLREWLAGKGVTMPDAVRGAAASLPRDRERLAAEESRVGADGLALVPVLYALASNPTLPNSEANVFARRGVAIADKHAPSPLASLALNYRVHVTQDLQRDWGEAYVKWLEGAVASPVYIADSEARAGALLLLADTLRKSMPDRSRQAVSSVADDSRLPANHPFKVGALIRIASLENAKGNLAGARAAFDRSGLDARQCALLDAPPMLLKTGASSGDFPMEAVRWGFEGWTLVESDVAANGKVQNPRVIASYPPFVFSKAGASMTTGMRFAPSYRPDGGVGCGALPIPIRFQLQK